MFRWLFNAIKRWALWLATGQLISAYNKEKTFKQQFDEAKWFNKLTIARNYLLKTNKKLVEETNLDSVLESVKTTATQAQEQIKTIDKKKIWAKVAQKWKELANEATEIAQVQVDKVKNVVQNQIHLILPELKLKLKNIETQLDQFEERAKNYMEEERTEQYRQIASKVSLWKKTATKHISDGIIDIEEAFELEGKIKYLSEKLEELKSGK